MSNFKKVMTDIVGEAGYQTLTKAVFKMGTQTVVDPLEFGVSLVVAPRAILSWLVQNVRPMKQGELKNLKFPGRDDVTIEMYKQATDMYRAEFIQGGKVIHKFENTSLPIISSHLMTALELYDHLDDKVVEPRKDLVNEHEKLIDTLKNPSKEKIDEEIKEQSKELKDYKGSTEDKTPMSEMVRTILQMNSINPSKESDERYKWMYANENVKDLTSVIGKLVDALVYKHAAKKELDKELDVLDKEELKIESKVENSITPEEKGKEDLKACKADESIKDKGMSIVELDNLKAKPESEIKPPKSEAIKQDESQLGKLKKDDMPISKPSWHKSKLRGIRASSHEALHAAICEHLANTEKKEVNEPLLKPQEPIVKASEMPGGAAMPKGPKPPQPPKPPVPAGNSPLNQAAKQSQAAARGKQTAPQTSGAPKNKAPGMGMNLGIKKPSINKNEYFRSKLNKTYPVSKEEFVAKCEQCGIPNFKKSENNYVYNPCHCFKVTLKSEDTNEPFLKILKKNDGTYGLSFREDADQDTIKAFLLTIKSRLLF